MSFPVIFRALLGAGLAFFMVENAGVGWDSWNGLAVIAGGAVFGLGWHWLKSIGSSPDSEWNWIDGGKGSNGE